MEMMIKAIKRHNDKVFHVHAIAKVSKHNYVIVYENWNRCYVVAELDMKNRKALDKLRLVFERYQADNFTNAMEVFLHTTNSRFRNCDEKQAEIKLFKNQNNQ